MSRSRHGKCLTKAFPVFLLYLFYIYAQLSTHIHVHQTRLFGKHAFIYHNNLARALQLENVGTLIFLIHVSPSP